MSEWYKLYEMKIRGNKGGGGGLEEEESGRFFSLCWSDVCDREQRCEKEGEKKRKK